MTKDRIRVVEERESWLLVADGDRYAVLERRAGRIYGLESSHRTGEPDSPAGMRAAAEAEGWHDEAGARALFGQVVARGRELARRML